MKCILDESVSYGLAEVLRNKGYSVTAIAESSTTGIADTEVYKLVVADRAVLITRDAHFTNAVRFPSEKTGGIIYIRRGNLTAPEEIDLVEKFLSRHTIEEYNGKLVTLYKGSVKIR